MGSWMHSNCLIQKFLNLNDRLTDSLESEIPMVTENGLKSGQIIALRWRSITIKLRNMLKSLRIKMKSLNQEKTMAPF